MIITFYRRLAKGIEVTVRGGEYARTGVYIQTFVPYEQTLDGELEVDHQGIHEAVQLLTSMLSDDRGF